MAVDLELVIAADVSYSMDIEDQRFVIPKSFAQCARRIPRQDRGHLCRVGRLCGPGYSMDHHRQRRKCRLVCCAASPDLIAINHPGGPGIASWITHARNGALRSLIPINSRPWSASSFGFVGWSTENQHRPTKPVRRKNRFHNLQIM